MEQHNVTGMSRVPPALPVWKKPYQKFRGE